MKITLLRPFYDKRGKYWPKGEVDYNGPIDELPSYCRGNLDKPAEALEKVDDAVDDDGQTTLDI